MAWSDQKKMDCAARDKQARGSVQDRHAKCTPTLKPEKNLALEGLRGVACLNVVFGHFLYSFFPYLGSSVRPYPGAVAKYWFEEVLRFPPFTFMYLADPAVSVFFVLSGYVLTRRFYATGKIDVIQAAAAKRYIRLAIPTFVSVIFAWLLLYIGAYANNLAPDFLTAGWVMSFYEEKMPFISAVMQGLVGAPLFSQVSLNGPLWSIQIELVGSILLFCCYGVFGHRGKIVLFLWFSYLAFMIAPHGAIVLNYLAIVGGSFVHAAERRLRSSSWLALVCLAMGIAGVSVTHDAPFVPLDHLQLPNLAPYGPNFDADHMLFWHTLGALFLVSGVIGSPIASRIFNHRVPVYLGRVSFAIYLLHFPLVFSLSFRVAQAGHYVGLSYWAYAGLALISLLIVLFVLAEIFYRFIDVPSIRFADWISGLTRCRAGRG